MRRTIESHFKKWKTQRDRLPIILRETRQVRKSFTIEKIRTLSPFIT